ncbi:MAG TPA: cupin domain-containing protein [Opitutaceae bacterium]|nr:cupin domain-containing protein [Opitutaceae bacterium]
MSSAPTPDQVRVDHASPTGYRNALPGIERKTAVEGHRTQLVTFRLAQDAVIPAHAHPQEQTGYLVSGRMILTIAQVDHEMRPGDSWVIPGGVTHSAKILRHSVAIEVFSPPRDDYRT